MSYLAYASMNAVKNGAIQTAYNNMVRGQNSAREMYDIEVKAAKDRFDAQEKLMDLTFKDGLYVACCQYVELLCKNYPINKSQVFMRCAIEEAKRLIYTDCDENENRRNLKTGDMDCLFYLYFEKSEFWQKNFTRQKWKVSQFINDYNRVISGQYRGNMRANAPFFAFFSFKPETKTQIIRDIQDLNPSPGHFESHSHVRQRDSDAEQAPYDLINDDESDPISKKRRFEMPEDGECEGDEERGDEWSVASEL